MQPSRQPPAEAGRVAVIIPAKDRAHLLGATLRSVRHQTLSPSEVIVVDDGSSDATSRVAEEGGATVIRNSGVSWGPAKARNVGLERVTGDYVNFLDSDDLLMPNALERLHAAISTSQEPSFAYGQGLVARWDRGRWEPDSLITTEERELRSPLCSLFARDCVPSGGALTSVEAARTVGGYDQDVRFGEDHDFWIRLSLCAPPIYVPQLVLVHRRHVGNRMTASGLLGDHDAMVSLAHSTPRLRACLPLKTGVELCEVSIEAVKQRRGSILMRAVWKLLVRSDDRLRILCSAARFFWERRTWAREGQRLWSTSHELRQWLASY